MEHTIMLKGLRPVISPRLLSVSPTPAS